MRGSNPFTGWSIPENWLSIKTIDAHTEGEPLRIILEGFPGLEGKTILEKRRYCLENYDNIRKALMWEPRGHADMYGALIVEAERADSDLGVIFTHNEGYSTMCGHGILGLTRVLPECGMIPLKEPVTEIKIDSPAGLITGFCKSSKGKIELVSFHNVPSYVEALDAGVDVPGLGKIKYDLAFGGAFYAFVDAEQIDLKLDADHYREIISKGMDIKNAVMKSRPVNHPFDPDLSFLYGTIFTSPPLVSENHSRNVCVFADGEVDRSPTGTGVSARAAIHYAKKEIKLKEKITIESIIGSTFTVSPIEESFFGDYRAVIPEVSGNPFITGRHEFLIDPEDPLREGFILR